MTISIFITAFGFFAGAVTIFCVFFSVKKPIQISKKEIAHILLWFALMLLGVINLYDIHKSNGNNDDSVEIEETNDQDPDGIVGDDSASEEESFIEQNFDLIQKLKAEYSDSDKKIIENDKVEFHIYENAGYIYQNLRKTERSNFDNNRVANVKMYVLDYFSDEIMYIFTPEKDENIQYAPGNQDKFYCVVFHDDFDVYVTPPIQAVGGNFSQIIDISLNKKDSEYTPLSQIRLHIRDSESDLPYSVVSADYEIWLWFENADSDSRYRVSYAASISDAGMLCGSMDYTYFSLNKKCIMYISLYYKSEEGSIMVGQETFDGSITNSNLVDIYLTIDDEKDTSN